MSCCCTGKIFAGNVGNNDDISTDVRPTSILPFLLSFSLHPACLEEGTFLSSNYLLNLLVWQILQETVLLTLALYYQLPFAIYRVRSSYRMAAHNSCFLEDVLCRYMWEVSSSHCWIKLISRNPATYSAEVSLPSVNQLGVAKTDMRRIENALWLGTGDVIRDKRSVVRSSHHHTQQLSIQRLTLDNHAGYFVTAAYVIIPALQGCPTLILQRAEEGEEKVVVACAQFPKKSGCPNVQHIREIQIQFWS